MKRICYLLFIPFLACASYRVNKTQQKPAVITHLQTDTVMLLPHNNYRPPISKRIAISGKWRIVAYYQHFSEQPIDSAKKYWVNIDEFAGTLNGQVCNSMSGKIKTGAGFALNIGPLISTKMKCADMQTEQNIFSAMQQANRFTINPSSLIFFQTDIPLLKLIKINEPE